MVWKENKTMVTSTTHRPTKKKKAKPSTFTPHLITLDRLYNTAQALLAQYSQFRTGQAIYTAYVNEVLTKQAHADQCKFVDYLFTHTNLDPFYNDNNIHDFVKFVTGKNDFNAWQVSFETLKQTTPALILAQSKVYCGTCEHYVRPDWCNKVLTIEDTPRERIPRSTPISKVNKNNDCNQYNPVLSLRILHWLKRIFHNDRRSS